MGVVVSARDEKLGRVIAIKVVPKSAIGDESARRRILREARAAAGLDHRSIVHVYDVGESDDHARGRKRRGARLRAREDLLARAQ